MTPYIDTLHHIQRNRNTPNRQHIPRNVQTQIYLCKIYTYTVKDKHTTYIISQNFNKHTSIQFVHSTLTSIYLQTDHTHRYSSIDKFCSKQMITTILTIRTHLVNESGVLFQYFCNLSQVTFLTRFVNWSHFVPLKYEQSIFQ